ncbi:MAG: type II toxin-antitoxin system RelE/ParE family toxin [Acetobacteraceae bacterium]
MIETPDFLADAKRAGLTEAERMKIVAKLASERMAGDEIPGTGGARKVRFAGRGKGKSGGYRAVAFTSGADVPAFLLNVFAKGDRVDLTQAERNELRKELAGLAADYRKGVARHVECGKADPA